jgi:Zn-finger nucleic acid-binding protein
MSAFNRDLRCPDDEHLLRWIDQGVIGFALCKHCAGLWFEREAIEARGGDLATVPNRSRRPAAVRAPTKPRRCPACKSALSVFLVEGLEIDRCPSCGGVWLDPGEYDAVRAQLRKPAPSPRHPRSPDIGDAVSGLVAEETLIGVLAWIARAFALP